MSVVAVPRLVHCALASLRRRAIVLPARGVPVEVALRVPERLNSWLALGVVLEAAMDTVVDWSVPTVTRRPALEAALEVSP